MIVTNMKERRQHHVHGHRVTKRTRGLTDVLISELVGEPHTLRLVLDRFPVHNGVLELFENAAMNRVALRHVSRKPWDGHSCRDLSFGRRANSRNLPRCTWTTGALQAPSNQASCLLAWCRLGQGSTYPTCCCQHFVLVNTVSVAGIHDLHQLVDVPTVLGADRDRIRDAV